MEDETTRGEATDAAEERKDSGLHVNKATRTHVVAIPVADGTVVAVFPVSVVNADKFYAEHDKVDA